VTSTAAAAATSTATTKMRSSTASTFFTTRPRATGDFSHGRRGRGVRYSRTIVNAYHVSLSCMQSPCAHHAPRWRRRVVSFCWCSFAAPAEAPATSPWRGRRGGPSFNTLSSALASAAFGCCHCRCCRYRRCGRWWAQHAPVAQLVQAEAPRRSPKVFIWSLLINPRYNAIKTSGVLSLGSLMAGS
jgi:hypothetical protein